MKLPIWRSWCWEGLASEEGEAVESEASPATVAVPDQEDFRSS